MSDTSQPLPFNAEQLAVMRSNALRLCKDALRHYGEPTAKTTMAFGTRSHFEIESLYAQLINSALSASPATNRTFICAPELHMELHPPRQTPPSVAQIAAALDQAAFLLPFQRKDLAFLMEEIMSDPVSRQRCVTPLPEEPEAKPLPTEQVSAIERAKMRWAGNHTVRVVTGSHPPREL